MKKRTPTMMRDERGRFVRADNHEAQSSASRLRPLLERLDSLCESLDDQTDTNILQSRKQEAFADILSSNATPTEQAELLLHIDGLLGVLGGLDDDGERTRLVHHVVPELIGEGTYVQIARELQRELQPGSAIAADCIDLTSLQDLPDAVREAVIERFVDLHAVDERPIIDETSGQLVGAEYALGASKRALKYYASGQPVRAQQVAKIFQTVTPEVTTLDDVDKLYDVHDKRRAVKQVSITTGHDGMRLLPINELRIGHQDGRVGLQLVRETIERVRVMPESELPDVILVANLLQGDFAHTQSKKRPTLVGGLDTMEGQFKTAKLLFDELKTLGIPIIHSFGADDHRIAEDYTKTVIKRMRQHLSDGSKFISYYEANRITQDEQFQEHLKFQLEHVLPLCYVLGRRLRTAEELVEAGVFPDVDPGAVVDEYVMLYANIKHGQPLPSELGIDPEDLVGQGEWRKGICTVDDVDVDFVTNETTRQLRYRHVENFTPETLSGNHTESLLRTMGRLGANGMTLPDVSMTGRSQEAVYATRSGVDAVFLPGLTDPKRSLSSSQYYSLVPGDASRRANMSRRRSWSEGMVGYEKTDDGRTIQTYFNRVLMEKADSLPRTAVFELCDFQIGSPTARPDLQVKYLAYILKTAERMPVVLMVAGDIIHGLIYPGMPKESQRVGLLDLQSQKLVVRDVLRKAFFAAPDELLDQVVEVVVQQGNHDEVQKVRVPGNNDANVDYLEWEFKDRLDKLNGPDEPSRVHHAAMFHTREGVPVPTWRATSHLGAYTLQVAHYHLERGMKGDNGGLPLYHAYQRAVGIGNKEASDIVIGGHWHNPQAGMVDDKLIVVGGAMAGRSQFEDTRGYDAIPAGAVVYLGGGQPLQVEFVHETSLHRQEVDHGFFTRESLADHGYHDDPGFDPARHGPYANRRLPKSGLQKALSDIHRDASERALHETFPDNPNTYDRDGAPQYLNAATQRIFERAV